MNTYNIGLRKFFGGEGKIEHNTIAPKINETSIDLVKSNFGFIVLLQSFVLYLYGFEIETIDPQQYVL